MLKCNLIEVEVNSLKHTYQKLLSLMMIVLLGFALFPALSVSAKEDDSLDLHADSAILVDAESGKILYAKEADRSLPPASMTKIMTEYLVWEAIDKGDIKWDTKTQISDYAYGISANKDFSGVGLTQNKDYTVRQLYEAMAINSDNATTIALAELIAGDESKFVKKMNEKAKEMGLKDSEFVNSTGIDNKDLGGKHPKGTNANDTNKLTAKSAALLAYNLVNDYPDALEISKIPKTKFENETIDNWNRMLPHKGDNFKQFYYKGVDGLKTGYTDMAGYCFTGTAERDGKRLITVVMQTGSEKERFQDTAKLLDYGYKQFESKELYKKGHQVKGHKTLPVIKGKEKTAKVGLKNNVEFPVKKSEEKDYSLKVTIDKDKLNKDGELEAPVKKGTKVGTAEIVYKGGKDTGYIFTQSKKGDLDVVVTNSVEKDNWFMLTLKAIGHFFANLFSTIFETVKGWFFVVR